MALSCTLTSRIIDLPGSPFNYTWWTPWPHSSASSRHPKTQQAELLVDAVWFLLLGYTNKRCTWLSLLQLSDMSVSPAVREGYFPLILRPGALGKQKQSEFLFLCWLVAVEEHFPSCWRHRVISLNTSTQSWPRISFIVRSKMGRCGAGLLRVM